ncbi:MAG: carbohydrate-binding domain-containing protein [Lachnospiraceae bacterium]|nr:carbohydrate-binding domain-containing protein [Lachnospiraceae bacterium]
MSSSKKIDKICIIVTILTLVLTLLFANGKALGIQVMTDAEEETVESGYFTANDLVSVADTEEATFITLEGDSATITGNGAYFANGKLVIAYKGTYVISGNLTGQIVVDTDGDDKVWVVLDGVTVDCEDSAALYVSQADKVFLNLSEGSVNTFNCGSSFSSSSEKEGIDGCIYSKDDLTISGTGSLEVTGSYSHGIVCNDTLKVTGGNINVTAKNDAIHANDAAYVIEATITLSAGDDGVTVSNSEGEGSFYMQSGSLTVTKSYEGIEAIDITIDGGDITVTSEDDGFNASGSKGTGIIINGGNIDLVNTGGRDVDGLDSNSNITINGGTVFVSVPGDGSSCAIDFATENGGTCTINGGTVIACGGSGMVESPSDQSKQNILMYQLSELGAAGSTLTVKSSDGTEIVSRQVPSSYSLIQISSPNLKDGETYTITAGSASYEVTLSGTITSNVTGGMGGMGGMGGKGNMGGTNQAPPDGSVPDMNGTPPDQNNSNGSFKGRGR